jgi:hypothetical protein
MRIIERAVERASRLPCRYPYRHSAKNVGKDADVAAWKAALRIDPDDRPGEDKEYLLRRNTVPPAHSILGTGIVLEIPSGICHSSQCGGML